MSKTWQFISTNEGGKTSNADARKQIRENAMRDYRRSERLTRMKKHAAGQNGASAGTASAQPGSTADLAQRMIDMQVDCLRRPSSTFDPFSTTALPKTNDAPRLLQYFISNITPQLQPLNSPQSKHTLNTILTQTALEDSGAISSILFHASLHCDARRGNGAIWSPPTLHYYGETIRMLNKRLQAQEGVTSDSSLCMVGFLAASGNITGDVMADKAHWSALQTMVDMRGGLNQLGWKGALGLVLQIGDLIHATISSTHPRLKVPDISMNPLTLMMPSNILEQPLDINDVNGFKTEITTLIELYSHLSTLQLYIFTNFSTKTEFILSFTQLSIALEYRLLSLTAPPPLNTTSAIYTAIHATLTICASLIFRNFEPRSPTLQALQVRLISTITTLYTISEELLNPHELKILLWILWIGALASLDQGWYIPNIEELVKLLGVSVWTELKTVLENFVWNVRLENKACWELCEHVGISGAWKGKRQITDV